MLSGSTCAVHCSEVKLLCDEESGNSNLFLSISKWMSSEWSQLLSAERCIAFGKIFCVTVSERAWVSGQYFHRCLRCQHRSFRSPGGNSHIVVPWRLSCDGLIVISLCFVICIIMCNCRLWITPFCVVVRQFSCWSHWGDPMQLF